MGRRPPLYTFTVPNLPKPFYEFLAGVALTQGMTQRQVVLAALKALQDLGMKDPRSHQALFEDIRVRFPARKRSPGQPEAPTA